MVYLKKTDLGCRDRALPCHMPIRSGFIPGLSRENSISILECVTAIEPMVMCACCSFM